MIEVNKAQCKLCGDVVESKERHDLVWCRCGGIAVDGGLNYLRRLAYNFDYLIELSEVEDD